MKLKFPCVFFLSMLRLLVFPVEAGSPYLLFNGFHDANLILNGGAVIESSGALCLTNKSSENIGQAFYPFTLPFINASGEPFSFSTSFVFVIIPYSYGISSEGFAFVITPNVNFTKNVPSQHLGIFNLAESGKGRNHIIVIEFDTVQNNELEDKSDNQVGINVNSLKSIVSKPASFFSGPSSFQNLSLIRGEPIRVWAEYDSKVMQFNVTIAPLEVTKPASPLLSTFVNLSSALTENMYVGFSSSTGLAPGSHYILGWSFAINGKETELTLSHLPSLSQFGKLQKKRKIALQILVPTCVAIILFVSLIVFVFALKKMRKFVKMADEWEAGFGTQRFSYEELRKATKGFSHENLLGRGGFGEVYKGVVSRTKQVVAVKRISSNSNQGIKEFEAEMATIGRLRHRNLVQLLGYTRRRGSLIIVYDYMPKGSLDKHLFFRDEEALTWKQRFHIIKGIAAGLLYLHEEWEQVVLHRDIKASNVLLDADFNGKLGDFGLARLHDRGSKALMTRVIGTLGYLAPELSRTGNSTTSSDVYAFGAFLLEVACGKRPVKLKTSGVELVLVDWVAEFLKRGELLEARDRRMGNEFSADEVELVLKLGLMCSSPSTAARPNMRQVSQYLEGDAPLPKMTADELYMWPVGRLYFSGDDSSG